ncbi:MAG: hypothetical protein ABIH00_10430 [Armatimonadota bacterium]
MKKKYLYITVTLLIALFAFSSLSVLAQNKPKELEASDTPHKITIQEISDQDILKDFFSGSGSGLDFILKMLLESKASHLGDKINKARKYKDADGLISSYKTLYWLEKTTGKKSTSVTSEELLYEISVISEEQSNPDILRKVARLWGDPPFGNISQQTKYLNLAKEAEKADPAKTCYIQIFNKTSNYNILLYLNSTYIEKLAPGSAVTKKVPAGKLKLLAQDEQGYEWGPRNLNLNNGETFLWKLYE